MKNLTLKTILAAGALSLTASLAMAQERVVNVYNWSDYIDESILTDFTKETGIKVVYDVFDSNEVLETKMLSGKSGYDVVVPTASFLSRQIEAGAFQKLDKSKLPNMKNMWDVIQARLGQYGPLNEYAVNYMWGTTGLGYNVGKIKEIMPDAPTNSLAMIFDPEIVSKFKDCGVYILDAPEETIPAALTYLGIDPNTEKKEDLAKAEELFVSIRPYITKFHSSEYINALANGDACLALGWSGDILQARDRAAEAKNGVEVNYQIPKEGAMMWFDNMAIPVDADHPEEAHMFLDYIMRPEVMAKASNYVYYANGNLPSQKLLEEDVIGDPAIYPDEETLKNLYIKLAYGRKALRTATRLWTKVKTGQ